jgi:hypothetical protein
MMMTHECRTSRYKAESVRQREGDSQSGEDEYPPKQDRRSDNLLPETTLAKMPYPTVSSFV